MFVCKKSIYNLIVNAVIAVHVHVVIIKLLNLLQVNVIKPIFHWKERRPYVRWSIILLTISVQPHKSIYLFGTFADILYIDDTYTLLLCINVCIFV